MSHHLKWLPVITWLNSHEILQMGNPDYKYDSAKFDGHSLCESASVSLPYGQREVWVDVGYWTIFCVSDG